MDRKTAGRFLAIVCILITLTTGLMKALLPAVYDLIGSFCLVLVGLSMLAVGMIYCVVPYVRFPFNSRNQPQVINVLYRLLLAAKSTTVLMEEKPPMLVINGATCLHITETSEIVQMSSSRLLERVVTVS
uniref:Uncharacterized protein n=1 Tax=Daphnia galeata TaxID=27404 RepID=A0A8J2WIU2_9CRUS|nr:unnamed protein product [Daphnia galeata]